MENSSVEWSDLGLPSVTGGSKNTEGCKGKHHLQISKVKGRGAKPQILSDLGPKYSNRSPDTFFFTPTRTEAHPGFRSLVQLEKQYFLNSRRVVWLQAVITAPFSATLGRALWNSDHSISLMLWGLINT